MASKKRKLTNYKDAQLTFLIEGVDGIDKLWREDRLSRATARRIVTLLRDAGKDVADLENWVMEHVGPLGRGRAPARAGEVRSYRVQKIHNSGPFLRLPVDALGVQQGDVLRVEFDDDRIIVSK